MLRISGSLFEAGFGGACVSSRKNFGPINLVHVPIRRQAIASRSDREKSEKIQRQLRGACQRLEESGSVNTVQTDNIRDIWILQEGSVFLGH